MNKFARTVAIAIGAAVFFCLVALPAANAVTLTFNFDAQYRTVLSGSAGDTTGLTDYSSGLVDFQTVHGSFSYDTASAPTSTTNNPNYNLANYPAFLSFSIPSLTYSSVPTNAQVQDGFEPASGDTLGIGHGTTLPSPVSGNFIILGTTVNFYWFDDLYNSTSLPTTISLKDQFGFATGEFFFFIDEYNYNNETGFLGQSQVGFVVTDLQQVETPLPTALPLFATGLGALGLMGWRRKRKAQAAA